MSFLKGHWQLLLILALVFALWRTPVVFPLRIFVIFLHELSHGLAGLATGGSIVEISLSAQEGGHALIRGGNRFVTLSAGYLGSLLLGALILVTALRTRADRGALALCGLVLIVVAAFWIRSPFALVFCLAAGAVMLAAARYLPHQVSDLLLRIIGLTSLIYVPYDIFDDTLRRSALRSDARMLAEEFGGATILWGGLWLVLSLAVIWGCLRYGLGPASNITFRRTGVGGSKTAGTP
ncbi:M50 family metallopeptidase [Oceanicola sp. 502str15]|uniref:M50 family metallopeptidase n=1 Tax=Oceanicola sp. 502str15 TaxID=2696061 RepID=UPI0020965475|nr:M50 family metallopeptidase [Oceanicola sp. 502str15]MCO6381583.1 M50 family peptidase [Oceanicola sp. 502str15]